MKKKYALLNHKLVQVEADSIDQAAFLLAVHNYEETPFTCTTIEFIEIPDEVPTIRPRTDSFEYVVYSRFVHIKKIDTKVTYSGGVSHKSGENYFSESFENSAEQPL